MYFDKPGKDNTDPTLELAAQRAKALGLNEVVVASTTGFTAYRAIEIFDGPRITVVTYHSGFKEPFKNEMPDDIKEDLQNKGITVVAASHALSGIERSIAKKHSGVYPVLIMADTLRLFGQGIKVAVEVAVMAADAGTLSGNDIISIGGSGHGAQVLHHSVFIQEGAIPLSRGRQSHDLALIVYSGRRPIAAP